MNSLNQPGGRTRSRLSVVVAMTAILIMGLAGSVLASHQFSDVPNDHQFHDDITWMADAGITGGFSDGTFRPGNAVTRQAMAAFMRRVAGADPDVDPMVNASHLGGMTADEIIASSAKVQRFTFTVSADDWGNNLHYGSNNIFREYSIPSQLTGGVAVSSFFSAGGTVVLYANAHHAGGGSLGGTHTTPYLYQSLAGIGVKTMLLPGRGSVAITRTTVGWDHLSIAADDIPDSVDYTLVFIHP